MIPPSFTAMTAVAHPSWRSILSAGLQAIDATHPGYLEALADDHYLPNGGRVFNAFTQPVEAVRYVLVGEGPYPRPESATGVCFMDGAVGSLWSEKGLSKPVNRATSLRNFMKMLLVADGQLSIDNTTGEALSAVADRARAQDSPFIETLHDLQANLLAHGFLLLNATLVYRPHVAPVKEAKAWLPFLQAVLAALADHAERDGLREPPVLVLWGKIATQLEALPVNRRFPKKIAEHPYNLSFIGNPVMQSLFGPMRLLHKPAR
jgi:uracil-DNA glycosylase